MEEQVRELQKKIESAKAAELEANDPAKKVADLIHTVTCHSNHVDMCGWEYENSESYKKPGTTRNRYYVRAQKLIVNENVKELIRIITKFHSTR